MQRRSFLWAFYLVVYCYLYSITLSQCVSQTSPTPDTDAEVFYGPNLLQWVDREKLH